MQDVREGFDDLKKDTFVFSLILTALIAGFFFSGPINIAIPLYAEEVLHGTALDLSYLEMVLSAGMINEKTI
jgi:MFS transporter, DHA3 family, macrolide efflux protein